jgi:hypothetical protein
VPRYLMQLPADQKHAVVVDTRRSRLYLYENVDGRPRFVPTTTSHTAVWASKSCAKATRRRRWASIRSPAFCRRERLTDFYGSRCAADQLPERLGPPPGRKGTASGCTARRRIPSRVRRAHRTVASCWPTPTQLDRDSGMADRLLAHYSPRYAGDKTNFAQLSRSLRDAAQRTQAPVRNVAIFRDPGKDQMAVVTFEEDGRNGKGRATVVTRRQYWIVEDGRWKIIHEGQA